MRIGLADAGPLAEERRGDIAHHNGPDIAGMAAGAAAGQHAEDAAEGHGVEGRADQVIIQHDEQAVDADVHQERGIAVLL